METELRKLIEKYRGYHLNCSKIMKEEEDLGLKGSKNYHSAKATLSLWLVVTKDIQEIIDKYKHGEKNN